MPARKSSPSPDYYYEKVSYMDSNYSYVEPLQFYREIFPEGSFQKKATDKTEAFQGNGMLVFQKKNNKGKLCTYTNIIFDDLAELSDCVNVESDRYKNIPFATVSLCSYLGKSRCNKNAVKCYGFAVDVDDVNLSCLQHILYMATEKLTPFPTYLVVSGNGVHVYYIFYNPIKLNEDTINSLNLLKNMLTTQVWMSHTSLQDGCQFQGITQCYRVPGTKTKRGHTVMAYRIGPKIHIDSIIYKLQEMNIVEARYKSKHSRYRYERKFKEVMKQLNRLANNTKFPEDMLSLLCDHTPIEEAKKMWPEWYQHIVINKEPKKHWTSNIALYNWWIEQVKTKAKYGGRYYCIYGLVIYAQRCGVSREKLREDAYMLYEYLRKVDCPSDESSQFKEQDVEDALSMFDTDLTRTSKSYLENKVKFMFPKSKRRNGRKQAAHLKMCRDKKQANIANGIVYDKGGRPTVENKVMEYLNAHPDETNVSKIAGECGVARNTVYKYMKKAVSEPLN